MTQDNATGPSIVDRVRRRVSLLVARQRRRLEMWRGKPPLHVEFLDRVGYPLDLDDPRTFNAKIQVRKLRDRNPAFPILSDKLRARDYVASVIGAAETEALCVPVLGATENPTRDWLAGFGTGVVVKANHGSLMNALIPAGATPDYRKLERSCRRWLAMDYGADHGEWAYTLIPRRILVEPMLTGPDGGVPADYKFFVFDGTTRLVQITHTRFTDERNAYVDRDWNKVSIRRQAELMDRMPDRPAWFTEARDLAERIAAEFDHLRVDFLCTPDRFWLGELTLYTSSGCKPITPESFDYELGAHWKQRLHPGVA